MTLTYSPLLVPFFAALFSLAGTLVVLNILRQCAVMDVPNVRSNHTLPVPRGGGIAMILAALLFLFSVGVPYPVLGALLLLAVVSFADDLGGVRVSIRFGVQLLAVGLAYGSLPGRIFPPAVPVFCEGALVVLAWLWFINLTNFMDGIDGITSLEAIAVCVGICLLRIVHPALPMMLTAEASVLAAAVFGFYVFNRSPAKLFMGDVGSIPLGFLLGYLLLSLAMSGLWVEALILPAYYLSDATLTLCSRFLRGQVLWQAHSDHAYQRAVRAGLTHAQVTDRITLLNLLLVGLALAATHSMMAGALALVAAYLLTFCLLRHFIHASSSR